MLANLNMGSHKISNLKDAENTNDGINLGQLQSGLLSKADKTELNDYILKFKKRFDKRS